MKSAKARAAGKSGRHPVSPAVRSLFSPAWDALLQYQLSLVLMVCLLILAIWFPMDEPVANRLPGIGVILVLQALINWPHFMASYRLLYADKSNLRRYPHSTLTIPLLLACLVGVGVWLLIHADHASANNFAYLFWMAAVFYLAWHYTGQVWGVLMTNCRLTELRLRPFEIRVIRGSLRTMLVWHVLWAIEMTRGFPYMEPLQSPWTMPLANFLALGSFLAGAAMFYRVRKSGRRLEGRVWGPWLVLYLWYLVLFLEPAFFVFVQLSHALQYLSFPARVEVNTLLARKPGLVPALLSLAVGKSYLGCLTAGVLVFYLLERALGSGAQAILTAGMVASAVNIHHYFTDGAIWKLRDRRVHDLLLRHTA